MNADAKLFVAMNYPRSSYFGSAFICGKKLLSRLRRGLELHRFVFEKFLEPVAAELASVAGLFVATERRLDVERPAIDVHLAGAHTARDFLRTLFAAGPD